MKRSFCILQLSDEQLHNLNKEALIVIASSLQEQFDTVQVQLDSANATLSENTKQIELLIKQIRLMNRHQFSKTDYPREFLKNFSGTYVTDSSVPMDNSLNTYKYFETLLTEIPKHMKDKNLKFTDDLLPWSPGIQKECASQFKKPNFQGSANLYKVLQSPDKIQGFFIEWYS